MSSIQLLDKTRKINKLLHNNNSQKVVFNDICKVLTEVMNSNVLVISKKGKILGKNEADHIEVLHQLISGNVKDYVDFSLNERLLTILSTNENVSLSTLGFESDRLLIVLLVHNKTLIHGNPEHLTVQIM